MTTLEEFQKTHGEAFAHILQNPAFNAGMIHLSIGLMNTIKRLTDDQITNNAVVILSDLRGRLLHETALFTLALPPEPEGKHELQEEYPVAVEEQFAEFQRSHPKPNP